MRKEDLKIGMVVEDREGGLFMLMPHNNVDYDLVLSNRNSWIKFKNFNNDLTHSKFEDLDIMKVYGFTNYPVHTTIISTDNRKLLWKREEAKKMTVAEIENILGYKIEVVSES